MFIWVAGMCGVAHAVVVTYTYDDSGHLSKADYGANRTITYVYDKADNLSSRNVVAVAGIKGDLDHSGSLDLNDVILALKLCSGESVSASIHPDYDVTGDNKVTIADAVYILGLLME